VRWYAPDDVIERRRLEAWCAGVGAPVISGAAAAPVRSVALSDIVFVSWNVHVGNGRIRPFVDDLRAGHLTNGRPPLQFVLLLQEVVRTSGMPSGTPGARAAGQIRAAHQEDEDIDTIRRELHLSLVYVPSMRNGSSGRNPAADRGNAILSTMPLSNVTAVELPIEHQRRVAIFAEVGTSNTTPLQVGVIHLDATDASRHLRVVRTRSWRARQATALESVLPSGTVVIGADLNTWSGSEEPALRYFRDVFTTPATATGGSAQKPHRILDYLFFRSAESATAQYETVVNKYGSDHHPLIGWFNN